MNYVYIVTLFPDLEPNVHKVGFSTNITRRVSTFSTLAPNFKVSRLFKGSRKLERQILDWSKQNGYHYKSELVHCSLDLIDNFVQSLETESLTQDDIEAVLKPEPPVYVDKGFSDAMNKPLNSKPLVLDQFQRNIVIGTVLGGSSLVRVRGAKNHFLSMRDHRLEWLAYKTQELGPFFADRVSCDGVTYRCNSISTSAFSDIYDIYYQSGRRSVSETNLSPLMDIGLATWFLDGGSTTGRNNKNAYFSTTRLGQSGTEIVWNYFNNILELPCKIHQHKKRLRVLFSVDGTEMFFRIVSHRFPACVLK